MFLLVLTQTALFLPVHADQQKWGEGGSALRIFWISSGQFFKCSNGFRSTVARGFVSFWVGLSGSGYVAVVEEER